MDMSAIKADISTQNHLSTSQRRRNRRKKQSLLKEEHTSTFPSNPELCCNPQDISNNAIGVSLDIDSESTTTNTKMSTPEQKSREEVKAAREAKKLAKQKGKNKGDTSSDLNKLAASEGKIKVEEHIATPKMVSSSGKDEVDRAIIVDKDIKEDGKSKEHIKAERTAKKVAKQAKKKGDTIGDTENKDPIEKVVDKTMASIAEVTKDLQEVHAKPEEVGKSKAELKAERRAKQEAQRAAKQAQQVADKPKETAKPKDTAKTPSITTKENKPKPKPLEKSKTKSQFDHRVNWFQHLYTERNEDTLKNVTLNSNLHPAIVKLGVQLATRVVTGSNARCIALLDALKKMISDYSLPAKTEFARGLESALTSCVDYLWSMRQPAASQTNAVKFLRHHLTQLPNNVDEFDAPDRRSILMMKETCLFAVCWFFAATRDNNLNNEAKKTLHEEIDRYIREQIDMAGEAISLTVRNKISEGDTILTYGYSSLIERILISAWESGVKYSCVVVGARSGPGSKATALLRRLRATNLPCVYCDISAISGLIHTIAKVVVGASSLLVNGSVLGAAGTSQVALCAREHNVPVLVCCETHKFSERVLTDAFVYNELGDPDELIEKSDENSPLKDWRSNPNLTPLNLTYDVTPPCLVTAVVTELAILPCTSAPVVLRFKLSEYGLQG